MPKFLTKEYGPFTGGVWIVIIVGGVGLGLVMRKYFNRGDTGEFTASAPGPASDTAVAPAFMGGGTLFNQGEIVSEVLEAIKVQTPPPATTNPTNIGTGDVTVAALKARLSTLEQALQGLIATRASVVKTHEALKKQYNLPATKAKPALRADLLAEIESYEARRRQLNEQIAGKQAEITFVKAKIAAGVK